MLTQNEMAVVVKDAGNQLNSAHGRALHAQLQKHDYRRCAQRFAQRLRCEYAEEVRIAETFEVIELSLG